MHNSELRLHLNCALDNPLVLHMGVHENKFQCFRMLVAVVFQKEKIKFETYSYIQNCALDPTEIIIKNKLISHNTLTTQFVFRNSYLQIFIFEK